jgi:hypothetical protein
MGLLEPVGWGASLAQILAFMNHGDMAKRIVRAVFNVLSKRITEGEIEDIKHILPQVALFYDTIADSRVPLAPLPPRGQDQRGHTRGVQDPIQ